MKNKDAEYREIFLGEALGNFEEINRLLIILERNVQDKSTVNGLFRITHTLKGNAAGMGYTGIAEMAHVLEDLFGEVREGRIVLDDKIFSAVFKGVDVLGALINAVRDNKEVAYKGIRTKLNVLVKNASADAAEASGNKKEQSDKNVLSGEVNSLVKELSSEEARLSFSDLVQVPVRKLDNLLNLVGELIIEKDRILASHTGLYASNEYARLSRISSDLQYSVMDVRLVQVGFLFNKFHRVVRDAATQESKNVILKLEGTDTEIDRNVLQVISDSLIHLIRNAVGHGIESAEQRTKAGKPEQGTIWLSARNENDAVIITIRDDGNGLDHDRIKSKAVAKGLITQDQLTGLSEADLNMLIFEPGFSTADQVTAISGRGVGMDVVKKTIDSIGGSISVQSERANGTTIELTLPSSMAVKACLLFELSKEVYAIPLSYTESVISLYKKDIHKAGGGLVATHLKKNITIVFFSDLFNSAAASNGMSNLLQNGIDDIHPEQKMEIVVVNFNNRTVGFVVDKLLQQKEIVEKPLMKPIDKTRFVSGVTILGSGKVCLVLNVAFIMNHIFNASVFGKNTRNFTLN